MKKTMDNKPKKVPKDINGENTYEEREPGTPAPPPIKSGDDILDKAMAFFLKANKTKK